MARTGDRARPIFWGPARRTDNGHDADPSAYERSFELKKIYVGNLSFNSTDHDLSAMFAEHGEVATATVVMDRDTGRSRGFGFVEMSDDNAALQAIQAVNGKEVDGRELNVNEARPREPRSGGSGGGSRW